MSDNKTLVYILGAAVVLLAVIAGVLVFKQQSPTVPAATPAAPTSNATTGMPGIQPSTAGSFDPAKATKMVGATPKDHVSSYYSDILAGKFAQAFKLQPAASQAGGDVGSFQSTQKTYGMKSFKVVQAGQQGANYVVQVEQDLGTNGTWAATWTFVKYNNTWVVQSRAVSMK